MLCQLKKFIRVLRKLIEIWRKLIIPIIYGDIQNNFSTCHSIEPTQLSLQLLPYTVAFVSVTNCRFISKVYLHQAVSSNILNAKFEALAEKIIALYPLWFIIYLPVTFLHMTINGGVYI